MKRAMITVCGDFGDRHWVSDIMLTSVAKLSNALGQNGCEVVYADSMDNAQMANPVKSVEIEANISQKSNADILFVIHRDAERKNNLYSVFKRLRELLSRKTVLVLIDIGNSRALTTKEAVLIAQLKGVTFWSTRFGYDKLTMQTLLADTAFEASLLR